MESLQNVDTLMFDMDGTLTDIWKRYRDPFFRAIDQYRPDHDREKLRDVFERILADFLTTDEGNSRFLKLKTFRKSRKAMGGSLLDTLRVIRIVFKDPMAFREIVPLEGVESTLDTLQKRGYKLALVTSAGDKTVGYAKKKLEILNSFDVLVTRNTVKKIKPYPEGIFFVCEKLEKNPDMCAMIGDFPQDVQAGKNAGARTIAILGDNRKYTEEKIKLSNPDVILDSFQQLLEIFPNIK
jgi:pyrophosphatase PpaX